MSTLDASTGFSAQVYWKRPDYAEPHWYAAYTRPRHERRIAERLAQESVEKFLPLFETVHRWKDRKVRLQLPLFPSYIFVRISLLDRLKVLQVPGVVRLVGFGDSPTALPEDDILALRRGLSSGLRAEPHAYLTVGRMVLVRSGPLCGLRGRLVRGPQNCRIVISLETITRSIIAEVSLEDVDLGGGCHGTSR